SRPTPSPPRSSGAAPGRSLSVNSSTTSPKPIRRRARKFSRTSARCCAVWRTKNSWNCDKDRTGHWINRHVALSNSAMVHKPLGLLAELPHGCPLGCPYCSNPLALDARADELDTTTWLRVIREAAQLGVLQVHLSGGEPGARRDLVDITAGAHAAGLYTN